MSLIRFLKSHFRLSIIPLIYLLPQFFSILHAEEVAYLAPPQIIVSDQQLHLRWNSYPKTTSYNLYIASESGLTPLNYRNYSARITIKRLDTFFC